MALVLKDRVKETSTTTGTGTFTLAGAVSGFQSFSVIGNANTVYYAIVNLSASEWEVGLGTYTSSGTLLSRDTVLESSNSGSKVNFSAGAKDVFCTYPAEKAVTLDDVQTLSNKTLTNPVINGFTGNTAVINIGSGQFYKDTSGNVGIGTNSPVTRLDVSGGTLTLRSDAVFNTSSTAGTGSAAYIRSNNGYSSATTPDYSWWYNDQCGLFHPANNVIGLTTAGTERMRIDTSGTLLATAPNTTAASLTYGATAGQIFRNEYSELAFGLSNSSPYSFYLQGRTSSSTARDLTIQPLGGNVGIGTNSPSQKLDVSGNIVASGSIKATQLAATTTLLDTTLRTYSAGTKYTLPVNVNILGTMGDSFLVTLFVQYDDIDYHNWLGSVLITMTYWNAFGNNSQWSTQMSTHVSGNPTLTIYDTVGTGSRPLAFSLSSAITVATGGFVKAIVTRIASF